jgi:hypothetical protein
MFTLEVSGVALFNRTQFSSMTSLHTVRYSKRNFFFCYAQSHCLPYLLLAVEDYAPYFMADRHNRREKKWGMQDRMETNNNTVAPIDSVDSFYYTPLLFIHLIAIVSVQLTLLYTSSIYTSFIFNPHKLNAKDSPLHI